MRILGYATNGGSDELALSMLAHLLRGLPIELVIHPTCLHAAHVTALVRHQKITAIVISDLPPSSPSKTRYLVKRLHATVPDLRIVVGRWAPPALADEMSTEPKADGATHVSGTLLDTRGYLAGLLDMPRAQLPDSGTAPV